MLNKEIIEMEKELDRLRQEPPGSELIYLLNRLAFERKRSDPRKAEALAMEALDLAEKLEFPFEQARSCITLGIINRDAGAFTKSMSYYQKAMKFYEQLGNMSGKATVHNNMASLYKSQGMIDKALEHFHESLRQKKACGISKDGLALCHFNIGSCYASLLHLDLAQSSYEYARKVWEEAGDRSNLAYLYHNIGSVYGNKKELDKARKYFQKALNIREELGDKKGIASTLGNLGNLHEDLGDNRSALNYFIRSLKLYEEIGHRRGIAHRSACIGGIYTSQGRLDEAEKLIIRGLEITRELKIKDWEIHCLEKISDLYKAKGDFLKALTYSRELKTCLKEHMNEKSMEKIARLGVQFETEKKEKEAKIYQLKNVKLSKMNNQLRDALALVKKLEGFLPICANCKKIRDDDGYWQQIESYISDHSEARFSHGICPECSIKLYGEDFNQD